MRRRTKNTSKKYKNIETHKPRNLVVADHGAVLLSALTEHKSLKNAVLSIAPLKQQISVPFVHENIRQTLRQPNLAPDPTPHNETESSINIDDDEESSYSSPSYWFMRSWPSIFSLAIANLWGKKNSQKFWIKPQSKSNRESRSESFLVRIEVRRQWRRKKKKF